MPSTNDFLPFATGAGANVLTPAAWNPTPTRQTGMQDGIANPAQANTVWRQSQFVAAMLTQFIVDTLGQSVIDNGNLAALEGQFIAAIQQSVGTLPQVALWHFGRDTGVADLLTIPANPIITAYADGMIVSTIVNATNLTTTPRMAANGLTSVLIVNGDGSGLTIGTLQAGSLVAFQYDSIGAHWRLIGNISISQASLLHRAVDSGTANAMLCSTIIPPVAAVVDGMKFWIKKGAAENNAATALTIGAITAPVTWGDGTALAGGEWPANADGEVGYDSTAGGTFRLLGSPTSQSVAIILRAARDYYVDPAGNDLNDGLTAAAGRAFATLAKAASVISNFNLNNFSVNVHLSPGTFAGAPLTPAYGSGLINLIGAGEALTTVAQPVGSSLIIGAGNQWTVTGVTLTSAAPNNATADPGAGIYCAHSGSGVLLGNVKFGTCQGAHIAGVAGGQVLLKSGGLINLAGGLTANAWGPGASLHVYNGQILSVAPTGPALNISAAINVVAFANATAGGLIAPIFSSITNPSNLTGLKYRANTGGGISSNGGLSALPGTGTDVVLPGWAS